MPAAPEQQDVKNLALKQGLPMNTEAEMFVLGSVLLDATKFGQVAGDLEERDFAIEKHRRIYRSMNELHERGEHIDYITLANELGKFKQLENIGGVSYILELNEGLPNIANIDSYIKIVKGKALLRSMIETANGIVANCVEEGREVEDILADSERAVLQVGDAVKHSSSLESVADSVEGFEGGREALLNPSVRSKGLMTRFHRLDELTNGLRSGQLVVIAARPGMGKTAMALNIAYTLSSQQGDEPGRPVAVFSLEMSREALLTRILCAEAEVDQRRFRGGYLNKEEHRRLDRALEGLIASKLFIDDTANSNINEIGAKCRRLKTERGLGLVVVDYLQLLGSKSKFENRVQEISSFSRGLKLLAKELQVPVLALSQLSRGPEDPRRKDARPRLSDLRDSGSIEQDADVVCFIFREHVYKKDDSSLEGIAEIIIGKQRNGPTGMVKLAFLSKFAKFDNLADHQGEDPGPAASETDAGDYPPF